MEIKRAELHEIILDGEEIEDLDLKCAILVQEDYEPIFVQRIIDGDDNSSLVIMGTEEEAQRIYDKLKSDELEDRAKEIAQKREEAISSFVESMGGIAGAWDDED